MTNIRLTINGKSIVIVTTIDEPYMKLMESIEKIKIKKWEQIGLPAL